MIYEEFAYYLEVIEMQHCERSLVLIYTHSTFNNLLILIYHIGSWWRLLSRTFLLFILESKRECPNASAYQRQLKNNKKSLINCYERMIKLFDTIKDINVRFAMVYVIHKNRKFGEKEDHSDHLKYIEIFFNSRMIFRGWAWYSVDEPCTPTIHSTFL